MSAIVRFCRYGVVGLVTNMVGFIFFLTLLELGIQPDWATGICYLSILVAGYSINRFWTYRSQNSQIFDLYRFMMAHSFGLTTAILLMKMLSKAMPAEVAQIVIIFVVATGTFAVLELTGFGKTNSKSTD